MMLSLGLGFSRLRARALLAPGGVLALAVVGGGYVSLVDPNEAGHYPTCPFLAATGYQCPGCGTLRMVHALGHGQIGEAVSLNPLAFAMLPILGLVWVRWVVLSTHGGPARRWAADPRLIWALLAVVVVFWIARNLPLIG